MNRVLKSIIRKISQPSLFPFRPSEIEELNGYEEFILSVNNNTTRVLTSLKTKKDAKSALLLHGWGGHPLMLSSLSKIMESLGYNIYAPYLFGHDPLFPKETSIPEQVCLLNQMQEIVGQFDTVIAHSAGGLITAQATVHGFRANKVVLLSSPCSFMSLLEHKLRDENAPVQLSLSLKDYYRNFYKYDEILMSENVYSYISSDLLIVHGKQDRKISFIDAESIHQQVSDSELCTIEGTGHLGILRHTFTKQAITHFLSSSISHDQEEQKHARSY